jgi:hypothetical protein
VALRGLQKGRAVALDIRPGLPPPLFTGVHAPSRSPAFLGHIKTDAASVQSRA